MGNNRLLARLLLLWGGTFGAVQAQPPPPPPPNLPNYVHVLDDAYNERDLVAFVALFTEDAKLYIDGVLVASNRDALVAHVRQEFTQNLHVRPVSSAQGSEMMAFEIVSGCVPDHWNPRVLYHVCTTMRAVRYDLGRGGKITAMHVLPARAWNIHSEPRDWWEP